MSDKQLPVLDKNEIHKLDVSGIMTHLWTGVGPNDGVGLADRFTLCALSVLPAHEDWDKFPLYFQDWVIDYLDRQSD